MTKAQRQAQDSVAYRTYERTGSVRAAMVASGLSYANVQNIIALAQSADGD